MARTSPRLAIASCSTLPDWEVDDAVLHRAFEARGIEFAVEPWDAAVDWSTFEAVLIRTIWDYQERLVEFLAWLDRLEPVTRIFNPPSVVRWNARKTYLRDLAADGVPTIPTAWLQEPPGGGAAGLLELARSLDPCAAGFFLKPQVGATAWGTLPFDGDLAGGEAAMAHLGQWLARPEVPGMMLQPFLPSVRGFGECSVLFVDGEPAHGVRKIPVPGDYRVQNDFGASDQPWEPPAPVPRIASAAMASAAQRAGGGAAAPLLYGRADFLRDDVAAAGGDPADGWRIVELELIEPSLFLRHSTATADRLADAVEARLAESPGTLQAPRPADRV